MNVHSGRVVEGTVFVPVARVGYDAEFISELDSFDPWTLAQAPYYCDAVIVGARRSVSVGFVGSRPPGADNESLGRGRSDLSRESPHDM